jgi:hypothetical protein
LEITWPTCSGNEDYDYDCDRVAIRTGARHTCPHAPAPGRQSRLGRSWVLSYFGRVSFFLRLIGILNAAVWFGTAVFFAVAVWPGFFSTDMLRILPLSHSGAAAQVILGRFCILQYWCGGIAVGHLVLERLYAGKPLQRWIVYWVAGLFAVGLFDGLIVRPSLAQIHLEFYGVRSTPRQREQASKSLRLWQELLRLSNAVVVLGLGFYVWESTNAGTGARFVGAVKLRG